NVCRGEFARRSSGLHYIDQYADGEADKDEDAVRPLWQEPQVSPETEVLHQRDTQTIRRLVAELPDQFREAIVLREINDLSYRDIADVIGVPVGTVMSRLARARSMLRKAWIAEEGTSTTPALKPKFCFMRFSMASSMPGTRAKLKRMWRIARIVSRKCVLTVSYSKPWRRDSFASQRPQACASASRRRSRWRLNAPRVAAPC